LDNSSSASMPRPSTKSTNGSMSEDADDFEQDVNDMGLRHISCYVDLMSEGPPASTTEAAINFFAAHINGLGRSGDGDADRKMDSIEGPPIDVESEPEPEWHTALKDTLTKFTLTNDQVDRFSGDIATAGTTVKERVLGHLAGFAPEVDRVSPELSKSETMSEALSMSEARSSLKELAKGLQRSLRSRGNIYESDAP